jgi:signal transduction histidine kinase
LRRNQGLWPFPAGPFLLVIIVVCIGIAISGAYGYYTLSQFRDKYLEKLGHDIATQIDAKTRGPGNRTNLSLWGESLEDSLRSHAREVAYILLYDLNGQTVASAGDLSEQPHMALPGYASYREAEVYLFEEAVLAPPRAGASHPSQEWRLRIALYTAPADFIMNQAHFQIAAAAMAIIALIALAAYSLKTLNRVLELKAREQSERHLTSLGKMAASLAHEIRNPLGAIKGLTQVVQEDLPAGHSAQPLMQTVVSEAERLERLITGLLTFARPKDALLTTFDVKQMIQTVAGILQTRMEESKIRSEVIAGAEPLIVTSDEDGLQQVLFNVLLNAIEATPRGGKIAISVRRVDEARQVEIIVKDTGGGIGRRDPDEFFQPFATTKVTGSGLGLAVSRQIVEQLGGRISLANCAEGGACCSIRLPVARASSSQRALSAGVSGG